MCLAYDLRFKTLAPALAKAIGAKVVELVLGIVGGIILLLILAYLPVLDKKRKAAVAA